MMRRRNAFTLIELITVIAITAVLLTIITVPLIQSFNTTQAARSFADAQNRARILMDQMVREISNAAFVRDNSGRSGQVTIEVPRGRAFPNETVRLTLENARLDIYAPAQGTPSVAPGGGLINPDTGKVDPTLRTPKGDVNLPVTEGFRLIRYWVGLKNPVGGTAANPLPGRYNNPYEALLNAPNSTEDNLYVLWRAEVNLREFDAATNSWVINRELFDLDGSGAATPQELEQALEDPNFFVFTLTPAQVNNPASAPLATRQRDANRIQAWRKRARIVTETSRYDLVQVEIDRRTRAVQTFVDPVDGIEKPRVISLVEFAPTRVSNEPMTGMLAVRSGEETPNAAKVGPDVFTSDFGNLSSPLLRVRPSSLRDSSGALVSPWTVFAPWISGRQYLVGRDRVVSGLVEGYSQFMVTAQPDTSGGTEVFDVSAYLEAASLDRSEPLPAGANDQFRYPFSWAIAQAAARNGAPNLLTSPALREDFIPLALDRKAGKIVASFSIEEVGNNAPLPAGFDRNQPASATGDALPPAQDPLAAGPPVNNRWGGPEFNPASSTSRINQRFNALWNDWDAIAPSLERANVVRRFVDLRVVPQIDGAESPLDPRAGFARARIVPGSEVVIGPDQTAGANYGRPIRYTRVPTPGNVGPNQYYINYVNQVEPNWSQLGFAVDPNIFEPTYYDDASANWQNRLVSQILQPRYRPGYLEFNSRPGEPLPAGTIFVSYRFQFTEPSDVVEIDYDSRQLINISLAVRNFPQGTLPNQQGIAVKGQASVRNLLR